MNWGPAIPLQPRLKIPKYNHDVRPNDQLRAELLICSLLTPYLDFETNQAILLIPLTTLTTSETECPLPIYAVLKIHGEIWEKYLIDTFYKLSMCTSYNGLLSISNDRTNRVIDRYDNDGVVCPSELRHGIFTTVAVHHIDHNQSSTSSHDALHGTTISLVQHPTTEKPGTDRATDVFDPGKSSRSKKIASLLVSCYTDVLLKALL